MKYIRRHMDRPPPQIDQYAFRLLAPEEFNALPFAAKLEYLRATIQARKVINAQIEETLFSLPRKPQP